MLTKYTIELHSGQSHTVAADSLMGALLKCNVRLKEVKTYECYNNIRGVTVMRKQQLPSSFIKSPDEILDSWKGRNNITDDLIPFMTGRPERTKVISEDEITNVRIAVNSAKSLKELLLVL